MMSRKATPRRLLQHQPWWKSQICFLQNIYKIKCRSRLSLRSVIAAYLIVELRHRADFFHLLDCIDNQQNKSIIATHCN